MVVRLFWWLSGKESTCNAGDASRRPIPELGRSSGERKWHTTPVFLPVKSQSMGSQKSHINILKLSFYNECVKVKVTQSCPTLCDPMNRSTPGLPVHHQLPKFTQTHVHRVSDAIQASHPLSSPSPPAPNPSQHQSLFQCVNSSHEVAKVLEYFGVLEL